MKKCFNFLFLFLALILVSCDKEEVETTPNIVEKAVATEDLSSLVAALEAAELTSVLEGDGPFTVFAPTNAAFTALLDSNPEWNSLSDIPTATLTDVLLFHVLSGKVEAADLSNTYVNTSVAGPNEEPVSLQVDVTNGVRFNNAATPSLTDVGASNGTIHIIDQVMLPPNVVNLALNNSEFSTLVAALTDARHTTNYVSVLSATGPFTVFAPTNAAFQALLDSNPDWNGLADIPIETLAAVLNYHVVNGANVQADQLTDGQNVEMLSGGSVTVDLNSGAKLTTSSGQSVNIALTDVQGTNGVVHVVDTVLLP